MLHLLRGGPQLRRVGGEVRLGGERRQVDPVQGALGQLPAEHLLEEAAEVLLVAGCGAGVERVGAHRASLVSVGSSRRGRSAVGPRVSALSGRALGARPSSRGALGARPGRAAPGVPDAAPEEVGHNGPVTEPRQPSPVAPLPVEEDGAQRAPRRSPRGIAAAVSLLVMCAVLLAGLLIPVPYAIEQPGPAIDVLGSEKGTRILAVSGHPTYPTDGALMMTTVSVRGGPGYPVTAAQAIRAWFDPTQSVVPRELLFPDGTTKQQNTLRNSVDMSTSQQEAIAVALHKLGIRYTTNVTVAGVLEGGPAAGTLRPGDVVLSINGQKRPDPAGFRALTSALPAGQKVAMEVRRAGKTLQLQVPTASIEGKTRMGIVLARGFDFPVDVKVSLAGVGGPSAGTMFALGIYDELTPGALAGGQKIAGTGTIDEAGKVGAIGGIRQKMVGAREKGAAYFLAPADNCDQVVGHVPDGMKVVKVSTFDDAVKAAETIGRTHSTAGLPTCTPAR